MSQQRDDMSSGSGGHAEEGRNVYSSTFEYERKHVCSGEPRSLQL